MEALSAETMNILNTKQEREVQRGIRKTKKTTVMTSEVNTVGSAPTLLPVNTSFVNSASDRTEPSLHSDMAVKRSSQSGVLLSVYQLLGQLAHQVPCEVPGSDRNCDMSTGCMASSSLTSASYPSGPRRSLLTLGWTRGV